MVLSLAICAMSALLVGVGAGFLKYRDEKKKREKRQREREERLREERERTLNYDRNPNVILPYGRRSYIEYLDEMMDDSNYEEVIKEALIELRDQNQRMNRLFDMILPLLPRLKLCNLKYPCSVLQKNFDAYASNREILVNNLKKHYDLAENEKERLEVICDIARDNRTIVTSLEAFYEAVSRYLAKLNMDGTAVHVTDLTAASELNILTKTFNDAITQTEMDLEKQLGETKLETGAWNGALAKADVIGDIEQRILQTDGGH